MNDQMNAVIDNLAARLGIVAEEIWPMLMAQARADAIYFVVMFFILCGGLIGCIVFAGRAYKKEHEFLTMALAASACLLALVLLIGIASTGWLAAFVNPEYYAMTRLFGMLKGD